MSYDGDEISSSEWNEAEREDIEGQFREFGAKPMTPEQIEVGYYQAGDSRLIRVESVDFVKGPYFTGQRIIGYAVDEDRISEQLFFLDVSEWKPSTREAFNAAVDRVAARVKGE